MHWYAHKLMSRVVLVTLYSANLTPRFLTLEVLQGITTRNRPICVGVKLAYK